ncbi:MAG: polyribonucleotide nucleotidyltransferase [Firmicutes bacterium]|nr:polyribonucleotide nucleotidyltransferase [Bacillota bacterium]
MAKEAKVFKTTIGGRDVTVEVGKYAEQASGSCLIRCGDTVVMTAATMSKKAREDIDFFPLSVDFEEKMYAMGKIPGGFKKREGRASDKAILTSRLIDRPLRPLFPKGLYNDVAIVATALSVDTNIPPEVFGMIGSSIALSISDIPFAGPTGSVVVGCVDGKYVINPDNEQRPLSTINLVVSGTKDAIMMVEADSKEVSEEVMLGAIMFGHEAIKEQVKFIEEIVKKAGVKKQEVVLPDTSNIQKHIESDKEFVKLIDASLKTTDRTERQANQDAAEKLIGASIIETFGEKAKRDGGLLVYDYIKNRTRDLIMKGQRPDGRKTTQIRDIWCEVGLLPRVHGSGVFTRGQTQSLTTCTLGTMSEIQKLDNLDDETSKRYMHHYNFPPYSVGEARGMRGPGRREIGHGALAERALEHVIPTEEDFPYAIRTVSEVISSNGSTSQASVCGSTLALMDAGVPLKAPVAGIAMGLIKDEKSKKVIVLSDIQGLEDFYGDMDFKVAGTKNGITAIQMDIKIKGIDKDILTTALKQAHEGRLHILGEMLKVLPESRAELSKWAPKIIMFNIDPDKIGDVIGKGGKVINGIIDETGVKLDIEDDGRVFIATNDPEMAQKAKAIVLSIVEEPEPGKIYEGKVVRILKSKDDPNKELGAFVNIAPGKDGMVHISKLSSKRVEKVTDVINLDDTVIVEVIKIDDKGRVDLRLKEVKK